MTCIVGLATASGVVYMGGDSCASDGYMKYPIASPKVFRLGEILIGYTTSFRMGQIIQYHLTPPKHQKGETDEEYIVTGLTEAVRLLLKDHGFSTVYNNAETAGAFLVGYHGALYKVGGEFQVLRPANGIHACGSGEQFALAAMYALEGIAAEKRIRRSLEITADLCTTVSAPFYVESMP